MTLMFIVIGLFVMDNAIANSMSNPKAFDWIFAIVVGVILVAATGFMLFALYTDYLRLEWLDMDKEDRNSDDDDFVGAEVRDDLGKGKTIMVLGPKDVAEHEQKTGEAERIWNEWKSKQA